MLRLTILSIICAFSASSASASMCKDTFWLFSSPGRVKQILSTRIQEIVAGRHVRSGLLKPEISFKEQVFSRDEIAVASPEFLKITPEQKVQLLENMGAEEQAYISRLGISVMSTREMQRWGIVAISVTQRELSILGDPKTAQFAFENLANDSAKNIVGVSDFWNGKLRESSAKLREIQEAAQMRDPAPTGFFSRARSVFKRPQVESIELDPNDTTFVFPWGMRTKNGAYNEIHPENAIFLAKMMYNMTLVENLIHFENGKAYRVGRDRVLDINSRLFLALNPQAQPLIDYLKTRPIQFNINSIYQDGFMTGAVEFVHQPFKLVDRDFMMLTSVQRGMARLALLAVDGYSWQVNNSLREVSQLLRRAMVEVLKETRSNPDIDISGRYLPRIKDEILTIEFVGLSPVETMLVALRLKEILE